MGKEPLPLRDYRFSDGTLVQLADGYKSLAERDLTDLGSYGITSSTPDDIEDLITAFEAIDDDEIRVGVLIEATDDKNTKRDLVETTIRSIMVRAKESFLATPAKVARFGVGAISQEDDNTLVRTAKRVHKVATTYQTLLNAKGVTVAYLTAYFDQITEFDNAIDIQDDAVRERDMATRSRIDGGNSLYKFLVSISNFGKDKYYTTNEAKYNDYLISDQANEIGNQRSNPNISAGIIENLDFTGVDAEDSFSLANTGANALEFYCASTTAGAPAITPITVAPGETVIKSGSQLGYDTLRPFFNVRNNTAGASGYMVVRVG